MSEKRTIVLFLPLGTMTCVKCLGTPDGQCTACSAPVCKNCWEAHKKTHAVIYPLTEATCVMCGNPPDGQCAYCPAPLCQNWECRELHELKHSDGRSDEEKARNPLKIKKS